MARPLKSSVSQRQKKPFAGALRLLVLGLAKDCASILRSSGASPGRHYLVVQILLLLNLAQRRLRPASLQRGALSFYEGLCGRYFCEESAKDGPEIDQSPFAAFCVPGFDVLENLDDSSIEALLAAFASNIERACPDWTAQDFVQALAEDALTGGWAHEYLNTANRSGNLEKTQFFTPSWIADYLCDEVLPAGTDKGDARLLDPACGAGHLLVPAFEKMAATGSPESLRKILAHSIYGFDLDETLLELTAFALYLTARDKTRHCATVADRLCDLPAPNLALLDGPLGALAVKGGDRVTGLRGRQITLPESFSAVVMNPPYLSTRTMDDTTADYLKSHFPISSGDLYTAFIQLAMGFLAEGGKLSTIVQQSFLSISRYRNFRLSLLDSYRLSSAITLGTGAFPSRPGEKVNNAILTIQKKQWSATDAPLKYLRLEKGSTGSPELISQSAAIELIAKIPGQPMAFHCPGAVADIFTGAPSLADLKDDFVLTNGLFTCDNARFVKLASEIPAGEETDWVPYDKGGGHKWAHETPYRVFWRDNGAAIRAFRHERGQSRSLPGESHYFQPGLTYSYIGTRGFKARRLSQSAIFDIASSAVFSLTYDQGYVLGLLNSALMVYLLSVLNPTVNFQIGDLRKLPFREPDAALQKAVAELTERAVAIVSRLGASDKPGEKERLALIAEEGKLQAAIDRLVFDHYAVARVDRETIAHDQWVINSQKLSRH